MKHKNTIRKINIIPNVIAIHLLLLNFRKHKKVKLLEQYTQFNLYVIQTIHYRNENKCV
jgi:hypothetical protein